MSQQHVVERVLELQYVQTAFLAVGWLRALDSHHVPQMLTEPNRRVVVERRGQPALQLRARLIDGLGCKEGLVPVGWR
ncbi:hypothetical protein CTZ28_36455 [Streptomyces shenzhenensis]|uniref:Uncharacterized protein n=1 Tax=Streptomyces shenzhenensis TaxID=943815 RepID=A0A3M0I2Y9_9ACTN|nr:hypothetical protein CTZ28_36455 [Streptomyces shenzhenensis]